jgi:hypothetical protein
LGNLPVPTANSPLSAGSQPPPTPASPDANTIVSSAEKLRSGSENAPMGHLELEEETRNISTTGDTDLESVDPALHHPSPQLAPSALSQPADNSPTSSVSHHPAPLIAELVTEDGPDPMDTNDYGCDTRTALQTIDQYVQRFTTSSPEIPAAPEAASSDSEDLQGAAHHTPTAAAPAAPNASFSLSISPSPADATTSSTSHPLTDEQLPNSITRRPKKRPRTADDEQDIGGTLNEIQLKVDDSADSDGSLREAQVSAITPSHPRCAVRANFPGYLYHSICHLRRVIFHALQEVQAQGREIARNGMSP